MSKVSIQEFIKRSLIAHGERYDYSKVSFTTVRDKVSIKCLKHGEFKQAARDHMRGVGCKECAFTQQRVTFKIFLERAFDAHGDLYSYDEKSWDEGPFVTVICTAHGKFEQRWYNHTKGDGCPRCYRESRRLPREEVLKRIEKTYGNAITLISEDFVAANGQGDFSCVKHGVFTSWMTNLLSGQGCPKCRHGERRSKIETDFFNEVLKVYPDTISSNRKILRGKELDVFIPSLLVGIEFNGDYWHSDAVVIPRRGMTAREMHEVKTKLADDIGIDLLFVWESDWMNERDFIIEALREISSGAIDPIFRKLSNEN